VDFGGSWKCFCQEKTVLFFWFPHLVRRENLTVVEISVSFLEIWNTLAIAKLDEE
jgi:hypothetical protein